MCDKPHQILESSGKFENFQKADNPQEKNKMSQLITFTLKEVCEKNELKWQSRFGWIQGKDNQED